MPELHEKLRDIYDEVLDRNPGESEFHQAVHEVLDSLEPVVTKHPEYTDSAVIRRLCEPERQIIFRVPWVDDDGEVQINRGFRVEFNSALGPYKGGLRFHPSVNIGIVKFLGFEQIFKNALTGLPIGGGKGGSDFDPKGRSEGEVMRFCQSFMTELYRHIGEYTDVPAGDIGVGGREIGYLFGQYKRITNRYESGVLTGKGMSWGGSQVRTRGHRLRHRLLRRGDPAQPRRVLRRQAGRRLRVGQRGDLRDREGARSSAGRSSPARTPAASSPTRRGSTSTCSSRSRRSTAAGSTSTPRSATPRSSPTRARCGRWPATSRSRPPPRTRSTRTLATKLIKNGCTIVAEGANMPATPEAVKLFAEAEVSYAPGKAANAGGVATSALEMQQNASRDTWDFESTEERLAHIMRGIHDRCLETADEYGAAGQLRRRREHRRLHPGLRRDAGARRHLAASSRDRSAGEALDVPHPTPVCEHRGQAIRREHVEHRLRWVQEHPQPLARDRERRVLDRREGASDEVARRVAERQPVTSPAAAAPRSRG